jgi:phosphohistidine phosphatase SixA
MRSFELILFRHGDKLLNPPSDPPLSPLGLAKAESLALQLEKDSRRPSVLWSSPKLRAQQSFSSASEKLGIPLKESPLLLEAQHEETPLHFENRIEKFVTFLSATPSEIHYACSHYDWVIRFSELGLGSRIYNYPQCMHWKPFQFVHYQIESLFLSAQDGFEWKAEVLRSGVIEPNTKP